MRRIVEIDARRYVVVAESQARLVLEPLTGGFADVRRVLGFGQKEMAEALGISISYVSRLETDYPLPDALRARILRAWPSLDPTLLPLLGGSNVATEDGGMRQTTPRSTVSRLAPGTMSLRSQAANVE